jgi:outer membrane protein OmpA-like peptidoglycan-associated protein
MFLAATGLAGCESARRFLHRDQLVAEPQRCAPKRFEVYFADSEAGLTAAARRAVAMAAAQLRGCDITKVRVIGLADARGGTEANLTLSQRRAKTVAEALTAAGWPAPVFEVEAVGDAGAMSGGVNEPLRRRTEVLVEAAPRR